MHRLRPLPAFSPLPEPTAFPMVQYDTTGTAGLLFRASGGREGGMWASAAQALEEIKHNGPEVRLGFSVLSCMVSNDLVA